jgi:lipopolysaccharide transport system permease protein
MFVTPVFWQLGQLPGETQRYMQLNYFLHLIEVLRAPMLGQQPSMLNYAVAIGGAVIGSLVTLVMFAHFRRRIPYWL